MDIQTGQPENIWLMAVAGAVVLLTGWGIMRRRQSMAAFASPAMRERIVPKRQTWRAVVSGLLLSGCLLLLALAVMDLRWGRTWREVPQRGIEVMFALDVSRSMLAEDVVPNRLERARQQIRDMIDEMAGDRIGLVVFAGDTKQVVPMTSHYQDFRQVLDSVGPQSVAVGGSRLGDALKAAADGFISQVNDHKAIVVLTDGEDQESRPDEVARKLHDEQGIRIFTVGLGDMTEGSRIPEEGAAGRYVQYDGQQVWSKMNGQILSRIATDTDGAYIPAGTKQVNMADVYHGYVAGVQQQDFETARINTYEARFQWFAGPAFVLLLVEIWVSTLTGSRQTRSSAGAESA
ncbi:MAG: VWA domain-containing protein [Planctomycetaceae bacterium]